MSVASTSGAASPKPSSARQQVELPFSKAYEFALRSIKIRFWRSMITAGGVFLGIAFLASVLTSKAIAGPDIDPKEVAKMNWLVALSLLVCAVGITNSMLMSVSERFREIGTMKCLGALNSLIVRLFLIEAIFMGFVASFAGWVLGFLGIFLVRWASLGWNPGITHLTFGVILGSLVGCVVIGGLLTLIAALLPAQRAAQMPPAAALRTEV